MPKKPNTSRTIGPLHFEDLEPHRFEDLIRQLTYEFREWLSIEAVGRTGSDSGVDSKAYEAVPVSSCEDDDEEDDAVAPSSRLWVIQCKRQQSFGPGDANKAISEIKIDPNESAYGLIVATSSNVSASTRRAFALSARSHGYEEFYLWGKGELEDQLFLPRNDHLLYAYFGISLQVRRRSQRTEQRGLVSIKKQLVRVLGDINQECYQDVLFRSADDDGYPFVGERRNFKDVRPWWYYRFVGFWPPNLLMFEVGSYAAYINEATSEWDAIADYNVIKHVNSLLWGLGPNLADDEYLHERELENIERERYLRFFEDLPEEHKGYLSYREVIPFERILAIDELGDRLNRGPHLIVARNSQGKFFDPLPILPTIERFGSRNLYRPPIFARTEKKIQHFPKSFPKLTKKQYEEIIEKRRMAASARRSPE